ncbi:hypothetical protein [Nostoc sp. TCL26-01]|uniref:hypothetical protein n=1 Tax=Nostoc sp. TCL26-01 TaxID=2576904 RepID=UPI0015BA78BD|nr:hypothetical protein [Nostoc sp. TCL26-01]QLE58325.1 hypothetical protein FD725_24120 [Nostoc sp. TCL26-01]
MSIIYPLAHLSLGLIEWLLIGWSIRLWQLSTSLAMIVLPIVLGCISYDNLLLSTGSLIGQGELLKTLSLIRFILHYLVVPLFIVIGVELAHRAGAGWANNMVRVLSWVIALGLATTDIAINYVGIELVPFQFAGILRYRVANLSRLPMITIIVNVFMLLIGIGIWIRLKWSWLFVGTLASLVGNAIPSALVGTIVGSTSEFLLAISLLFTQQFSLRK